MHTQLLDIATAETLLVGKVLLVINADTSRHSETPLDRAKERLNDFTALKASLPGEVVDWKSISSSFRTRLIAAIIGKNPVLAMVAFARRKHYRLFYCDNENSGLWLALLFKISRTKLPLLMVGHWITPPPKAFLFKWLQIHKQITRIFLHSSAQYNKAVDLLGIPVKKLQMLPYQVDTDFWKLEQARYVAEEKPYICAAGLEFRDYPTLIAAVRELGVDLKIDASFQSHKHSAQADLPDNVEVRSYSPTGLRDLYAGCCFVVVPLYDVDFQAGITSILEAMAMGKAVIVTRSRGQGDTVVDRRKTTRDGSPRDALGKFTELFGGDEIEDVNGQTGYYVSPGNPGELRRAIQHLLDHPEKAQEMGQRGRRTVEKVMTVELYAARIHRAVVESLK